MSDTSPEVLRTIESQSPTETAGEVISNVLGQKGPETLTKAAKKVTATAAKLIGDPTAHLIGTEKPNE